MHVVHVTSDDLSFVMPFNSSRRVSKRNPY